MKFSFLTYQFCRFGLEHSFKMAQEYGFEGVEVWGGRPHAYAHDMGREEIQAILGWKKQYGVRTTVERMDKATEILLNIVEIYSK